MKKTLIKGNRKKKNKSLHAPILVSRLKPHGARFLIQQNKFKNQFKRQLISVTRHSQFDLINIDMNCLRSWLARGIHFDSITYELLVKHLRQHKIRDFKSKT